MKFRFAVFVLIALFLEFLLLLTVQAQTPLSATAPQPTVPAAPDPAYDRARKLLQQGKYDEAIAALTALHSQTPAPKGLDYELGVAYYKKGDYPNAVRSLQAAQKEEPNDGKIIQLTGLTLYLAGKPADAIPFLEKVQTWYPRANIDAAYIWASPTYKPKNTPRDALPSQECLVCHRIRPPRICSPLACCFVSILARSRRNTALKPCPSIQKFPLLTSCSANFILYQSKIPEAVAQLEQEVAVNPANPVALYKLADAYTRIQKFDEAEKLLQRSIWLDATSTGPYILMGKVLEKKGEALLAVRALQRAINMDPNNSISHHSLGQAYRDLGRSEDAERELKLAEQLQGRDVSRQQ